LQFYKAYSSFDYRLINLLLLLVGLGPAINYFIPIQVIGYSLFSTLLPFTLLSFIYLKNIELFGDKSFILLFFCCLSLVFLGRAVLYSENIVQIIAGGSYFIYIPLLFSIFRKYEFNVERRNNISSVFTLIFLVHSLNAVFFLLGFPHVAVEDELSDDFVPFSRFTGILGGANVQANFTATLFMVWLHSNKNLGFFKITFFAVLALFGIFPTVSRGGLLIVFLAVLTKYYYLLVKASKKVQLIVGLCFVLLISTFYNSTSETIGFLFQSYLNRATDEDFSGGRFERITFTFDRLNENIYSYFIGIPKIRQTKSLELNISDNSGTLVLANAGLLCFGIFFYYIVNNFNIKRIFYSSASVYILALLITTFTNNAFLHFQWCTFAIIGYYLIVSNYKSF